MCLQTLKNYKLCDTSVLLCGLLSLPLLKEGEEASSLFIILNPSISIFCANFTPLFFHLYKMRTLQELINTEEPAWPIIQEWIALARNKIEVLPCDKARAGEALVHTQVTTRSMMGAVIYETGGILVDGGWIRIFGSGSDRMKRSLPGWNKGKTFSEYGEPAPYLIVADDAAGGLFAINGGYLGQDAGNMYYFAPDSLDWEPMGIGYSQFLLFCFENDLGDFYENLRWEDWEEDLEQLNPDHAYQFVPFLWTKEGRDVNQVSRKAMPADEVYNFNMEMKSALR